MSVLGRSMKVKRETVVRESSDQSSDSACGCSVVTQSSQGRRDQVQLGNAYRFWKWSIERSVHRDDTLPGPDGYLLSGCEPDRRVRMLSGIRASLGPEAGPVDMIEVALSPSVVFFVVAALAFAFVNGFQDSANAVATMIASGAMSPRRALILNASCSLIGPFLFGVAVARTIGHEVVAEAAATQTVVIAALFGAISWNLLTWLSGLPSSSSHALIGGLVGAALSARGIDAVLMPGLFKALLALLVSPILGMLAGFLLMKVVFFFAQGATPRINFFFKRAQTVTATVLALSAGTHGAQRATGIIAMGLLAEGLLSEFAVPTWTIAASGGAIALGTLVGGLRIIRTLGARFYRIRPVHSFTSQVASATVVLGAALAGGPVSTSHVVSTSILGAGSAERINKIRWGVVGDILGAWLLTIPAAGLLAAFFYLVIHQFTV